MRHSDPEIKIRSTRVEGKPVAQSETGNENSEKLEKSDLELTDHDVLSLLKLKGSTSVIAILVIIIALSIVKQWNL